MYISPINIIKGLHRVVEANREQIDRVIKHYRENDTLHIYDGLRKTLPLSAYPSLELDPVSANVEWTTTSAQTGEYQIECYLTFKNSNEEYSAEYASEVTRSLLKILNYPDNMCFRIPNEYYQSDDPSNPKKYPIMIQFGNVSSVNYRNTIDGSLTVAMFTWSGRVLEYFDYKGDGPHTITWKHDVLIGSDEDEDEVSSSSP